uniref:Uncharacterized protein n=1 Tax=Brassica campestris TaxID=3711 RepID=A0A3P5ZI75_BRACM|nr:unnamed protein product [Brassica rapa]
MFVPANEHQNTAHLESDDLEDKSDEHLVELFLERSNRDFEVLGLVEKLHLKVGSEELEEDKAFVEKLLVNWDSGDGEDNVLVEKLLLKRDFEDGEGEVLVEKLLAKTCFEEDEEQDKCMVCKMESSFVKFLSFFTSMN